MAKSKMQNVKGTIGGFVEDAYSTITDLQSEMQEWADNMEEKFSSTEKYGRISEAAETLGNYTDSPDVPEYLAELPAEAVLDNKKNPSRATRCGNATCYLDGALGSIEAFLEALEKKDSPEATSKTPEQIEEIKSEVEELQGTLDECKSEIEGVEFPGMYG